jgi:hypothetical protein
MGILISRKKFRNYSLDYEGCYLKMWKFLFKNKNKMIVRGRKAKVIDWSDAKEIDISGVIKNFLKTDKNGK